MVNWEVPRLQHKSSRRTLARPGIFLNVELGVAFSQESRIHTTSMKYTSKRMEERLHEDRIRQQREVGYYHQDISNLTTPDCVLSDRHERESTQQQQRQRRLAIRTTEQHQRGTSAPPTMADRNYQISPISPVSTLHHSFTMPPATSHQAALSEEELLSIHPALRPSSARRSMESQRLEQPLPPTPSQFRLGDADMPWSMDTSPAWYEEPQQIAPTGLPTPPSTSPIITTPTIAIEEAEPEETGRTEDPRRVAELETLQQAMMTVDSWEPWTWDPTQDAPRGPRSIGWAVSSNDHPRASQPGPPAYVVSQWEAADRNRYRPRSAFT